MPERWGGRYEVVELLGRGGMGAVYRVRDIATGDALALKCLSLKDGRAPGPPMVELFEREFHTLNQLAHPRVVRAFDYGTDGQRPFYTLELLDGGDLREAAPLPWERVCMIAYELCSVLSLLHSRRLVHRDLTPRNVRLTGDGTAKLIDFGLLAPSGPVAAVAGTPPYLAPEVVNAMSVDGRADLFALGGTLYYALTGKTAYPARDISELWQAWRRPLPRASLLVPDVPAPLERLVHALLRLDVESRPRSAAEVMDRIRPLLPEPPSEELVVARAHLSAPALVAREVEQTRIRKQLIRSARGRGGGFLITAPAGTGRSRMLDLFVLEAKLLGGIVARASGSDGASRPFGVARTLVAQLYASAPEESLWVAKSDAAIERVLLGPATEVGVTLGGRPRTDRVSVPPVPFSIAPGAHAAAAVQAALRKWILGLSKHRPVALVVDDLESVDAPSAALLAGVAVEAEGQRISYAASVEASALERPMPAIELLAPRARSMTLAPLAPEQTARLLRGVFGDVPNLQGAARQLHALADGRPRECMVLAQHLVDRGVIKHENGTWLLPATIDDESLPASMEEALAHQLDRLSPLALEVAQLVCLSVAEHLGWGELEALIGASRTALRDALEELRQAGVVNGTPDEGLVRHVGAARLVLRDCSEGERMQLHERLSAMHAAAQSAEMVVAHHMLQGEHPCKGVDCILRHVREEESGRLFLAAGAAEVGQAACAETFALAHAASKRFSYPPGDQLSLAIFCEISAAHGADVKYLYDVEDEVTALLRRATGFDDWLELSEVSDPQQRAVQAFGLASQRHDTTPEAEQIKPPIEAIKLMVTHALLGMIVASRIRNIALLARQPALLEPFETLNPAVAAMRQNLLACHHFSLQAAEAALQRWRALLGEIAKFDASQVAGLDQIRPAVQLAASLLEVVCGYASEPSFGKDGIDEPSMRVSAEGLRELAALQRGDWEAAEAHRRKAELTMLESGVSGMLDWTMIQWPLHVLLRDFAGIRAMRERIAAYVERHSGWAVDKLALDAHYYRLREQPDAAMAAVKAMRELVDGAQVISPAYYRGIEVEVVLLVDEGKPKLARERGLSALSECQAGGHRWMSRCLALEIALAEAALGEHEAARERIESEIAWQTEAGVTGLLLGHSYEYLARLAISRGDRKAFMQCAARVAAEYGVASGSMLAGRHRALLEEGHAVAFPQGDAPASAPHSSVALQNEEAISTLLSELSSRRQTGALAKEGLALLCDAQQVSQGWLFLLSDEGLSLVASVGDMDLPEGLGAFAQGQLELEVDDGDFTITEGGWGGAATAPEVAEGMTIAGGNSMSAATEVFPESYWQALPLRTRVEGVDNLVGIAVVSTRNGPAVEAVRLASSLARYLVDAGAPCSVNAA